MGFLDDYIGTGYAKDGFLPSEGHIGSLKRKAKKVKKKSNKEIELP